MLHEINGYTVADRKPVEGFTSLEGRRLHRVRLLDLLRLLPGRHQQDGSTEAALGAKLGGSRVGLGVAAQPPDSLQPRFGRSGGKALVRAQKAVWWDEQKQKWTGYDDPDFIVERPPSYRPSKDAQGIETISGDRSIRHAGGWQGLDLCADGLQDGPLPTHYEPQESRDPESALWAAV